MRMRAFALATTKFDGETYNLIAGFGGTECDDGPTVPDFDTAALLSVRVFITNNFGRMMAAHRVGVKLAANNYPAFEIAHRQYGTAAWAKSIDLVRVLSFQNREIVQAVLENLRSCINRDYNALAGYLVTCVDISDVPAETSATHLDAKITEASRNMEKLPCIEVGYRIDVLNITFNLGHVWFPSQEVAVVD